MNLSLDDEKPASRCRMYIIRRACHTASCCNMHALIHYLCQVIAQSVLLLLKQHSRSHWPRGLRCRSVAARLLGLRVRIPSGTWTSVCCECCMLSGRGVCVRLISPRGVLPSVVCVTECHHESSIMRRLWSTGGWCAKVKKKNNDLFIMLPYMQALSVFFFHLKLKWTISSPTSSIHLSVYENMYVILHVQKVQ
jgi:hypothetical protein